MFGDHLPSIETEFYEELFNVETLDSLSLEEKQKLYSTQFWIWSNYDIEEQYIDLISTNYLSTILLETAGINGSSYQNFYITYIMNYL